LKKKVAVALSGGVDSSVSAALLKEDGYDVIGIMMRLWSEPGKEQDNLCCTPDALQVARSVAELLDIPFYELDAKRVFRETVVNQFINGYAHGITPNPCLVCNRYVRWGFLLDQALALGVDYLATGHYARLIKVPGEPVKLLKGLDSSKDQSYVLSILTQEQLQRTILPLGSFKKTKVRDIARRKNLPSAKIHDSQDLCFLGGEDYHDFLRRYAPEVDKPGPILSSDGNKLGVHQGLPFYTIGQRKGLGISAPEPLYVIRKDINSNALIVGTSQELGNTQLSAKNINWISGLPPTEIFKAEVKIRYKARPIHSIVTPIEHDQAQVTFEQPLRDITPGQAAVFYNGDEVIGSGIILTEESSEQGD
jgi:tRNA-specific 2-thiouridylase